VRFEKDGRVAVQIYATVTDVLLQQIKDVGGTVVSSFPQNHLITAILPLDKLETVAGSDDVKSIRCPIPFRTHAAVSEGDVAHKANLARSKFGVDGTGVNVGVLSDSVDYLKDLQIAGVMPNVTILQGQDGTGYGEGEGTAMLEIVHDLAPGANLFFATGGNTVNFSPTLMSNNIVALRAAGCDIIIDDIIYGDESPFQDDIIAKAVNYVTADGAL